MVQNTFSLTDLRFVHRVVVGNDNPEVQPLFKRLSKGKDYRPGKKFLPAEHRGAPGSHAVYRLPCGI